ncbi:MAG: hypothetical protein OXH20_03960 [bacterium]|nr:hypothetical protein [bacterium]MDE0669942.1 hypothetical protein [bacterium]
MAIAVEAPTYETGGQPDFRLGCPDHGERRPAAKQADLPYNVSDL